MYKFIFDPEWRDFSSPPKLHFKVPLSPVIAAKKARPSDGGSDEVRDQRLIGYLVFFSRHNWPDTCGLGRLVEVRGVSTAVDV